MNRNKRFIGKSVYRSFAWFFLSVVLLTGTAHCAEETGGNHDLMLLALVYIPNLAHTYYGTEHPGVEWTQSFDHTARTFRAERTSNPSANFVSGRLEYLDEGLGYNPLMYAAYAESGAIEGGTAPDPGSYAISLVADQAFAAVSPFQSVPGSRLFTTVFVPSGADCDSLNHTSYNNSTSTLGTALTNINYGQIGLAKNSSGQFDLTGSIYNATNLAVISSNSTLGSGTCDHGKFTMTDSSGGVFYLYVSTSGTLVSINEEGNGGNFAMKRTAILPDSALVSRAKEYKGFISVFDTSASSTAETVYPTAFSCDTVQCVMNGIDGTNLPTTSFPLATLDQGQMITNLTYNGNNYNMIASILNVSLDLPRKSGPEYAFTFIAANSIDNLVIRGFFLSNTPVTN